MELAVVGTGHVGAVTCAALSALGHRVVGTDVDAAKLDQLQRGVPPFHEPGFGELLRDEMRSGRLRFDPSFAAALGQAEVVFICVGTPPRIDGSANLVAVESSARLVARHAPKSAVIVEKSTVIVGTAGRLRPVLDRARPDHRFEIVSNPEFLREGTAVRDAMSPDRILVGSDSDRGFEVMRQVYAPLVQGGVQLIETDVQTAELAKHASNAFLALKISFVNAMARVCELAGADVKGVADVMAADPRIGGAFLSAGIGYGGSCFPKDLAAFAQLTKSLHYELPLLGEIARLNDEALEAGLARIEEALWNVEGKVIALLGLAYKPGTDDVRFSPALRLAERLGALGAVVRGFDPQAGANAKATRPELEIAEDPYEAARGADCVVVCTAWDEVLGVDLERLHSVMNEPVLVDGRNAFDPSRVAAAGFSYYPVGRPAVVPAGADALARSDEPP